jgi:hypothetical protein
MNRILTNAYLTAFALAAFSMLEPAVAQAFDYRDSPYGNSSVFAFAAEIGGDQKILWYRLSDSHCTTSASMGGSSGLNDNYEARAGEGNDTMVVYNSSPDTVVCSNGNFGIEAFTHGFQFLDLNGRGGDDQLYNNGGGDTWEYGGSGRDTLYNANPGGTLDGGDGGDWLTTTGTGGGESLLGGNGNDCLYDGNASAATFDCGADSDTRITPSPTNHANCDSAATVCP